MKREEQEARAKQMWTRGDYRIVGDWFAEASRGCLSGLDCEGKQLLDVACGTGAVAIEAARRGATVVGLDLTPSMLEEAAKRAAAANVAIDWQQGSFMDLSGQGPADFVTSAFGAMFASDPGHVLGQLAQACRPGGVISVAAWAPKGAFGGAPPDIIEAIPMLGQGTDVTRWATEEGLNTIIASAPVPVTLTSVIEHTIGLPFTSAEECIDLMIEYSGPWGMLFDIMKVQGIEQKARTLLLEHIKRFCKDTDKGVELQVKYTIAQMQTPA